MPSLARVLCSHSCDRTPTVACLLSKELDALCELLGDKYEPHLRALPYAFAGDAAAGARSLKYHAEKKALAAQLALGYPEPRVQLAHRMCADCHALFKAASAAAHARSSSSERGSLVA